MSKSGGEVKETSQQRALADIGKQQLADYKARWQPLQMQYAADVSKAGLADSFDRRHATAKVGVDTSVNYAQAANKLDAGAAARGGFGGSAHKLGITGMAGDQATSAGMGAVAADQAVTNQYVSGLGAVTALGRGEKATAISGMGQAADISGRQAAADAQQSLENRTGNMRLAGTLAGYGLQGAFGGSKPTGPGLDSNTDPSSLWAQNGSDVGQRW